jgi:hypothetical protein
MNGICGYLQEVRFEANGRHEVRHPGLVSDGSTRPLYGSSGNIERQPGSDDVSGITVLQVDDASTAK